MSLKPRLRHEMTQIKAARRYARRGIRAVSGHAGRGTALRLVRSASLPGGVVESGPASDQSRPLGVAFVGPADVPGGRIYVCDADAHTIDVLDQHGRPLFSFGGFGAAIGQLDTPTDVVVIRLETAGPAGPVVDTPLLAVADRGNHRLQLFELDGAVIGELGGHAGAWTLNRFPAPAGSPFFRLGDVPPIPFPSRLQWRAPYLDVACAGTVIRLDLAAVLLPDFTTWVVDAPRAELRLAFLRFATAVDHAEIPESCLYEIAERLQPTWCGTSAPPQH